MHISRRQFIQTAGGWALAASLHPRIVFARPPGPQLLPIPDFSEENIIRFTACIRPHRDGSIRLEKEDFYGKALFHHYGHGGAGITLSWGSAELLAEKLERSIPRGETVAVAGAGVIGLSTAYVLAEHGYSVHIYSKDFWPNTTSSTAGGQWSPAGVEPGTTDEERAFFRDMLIRSHRRFSGLQGSRYGIYPRPNYMDANSGGSYHLIPPELIAPVETLETLPFPGTPQGGAVFHTFLIEPPTYLPQLTRDLLDRGVQFHSRDFHGMADLAALPENAIVNCLGIGSKQIFADPDLVPYRGQLVHLKPKVECEWLLVHERGYIFPRHDAVVLGGTYERGILDPTPDPAVCLKILEKNRRFFT